MHTQAVPKFHIPRLLWATALISLMVLGAVALSGRVEAQQTTAIDPGPGTEYISPRLWAILQRQANGDSNLPLSLDVEFTYALASKKDVTSAIASAGGKRLMEGVWQIPTNKTLGIIQRQDVYRAELYGFVVGQGESHAPRMNGTLAEVVAAFKVGLPSAQAAKYALFVKGDGVAVRVGIPDASTEGKVRKWLTGKGLYVPTVPSRMRDGYNIAVLLPVNLIEPLLNAFPSITLFAASKGEAPLNRAHWPQEAADYEQDMVSGLLKPSSADNSQQGGVIGASSSDDRDWEVDLEDRQEDHGVDLWHDVGLKGKHGSTAVKIGIIDWGFAGLDETPGLDDFDFVEDTLDPSDSDALDGNAFCQSITKGTWPNGWILTRGSEDCEPRYGASRFIGVDINHGVNVAEIVQDMAPDAEILYAQANSPRQLYRAAYWLKEKGVDVIVHAGGWPFDGKGDGTGVFGVEVAHKYEANGLLSHEHSTPRYQPSPLSTVDEFVTSASGPVWINAAGNSEQMTMFIKDPQVLGGTGALKDFLVLNSGVSASGDPTGHGRTCQQVPMKPLTIYSYSMRWADSWPAAGNDLDFVVSRALNSDPKNSDSNFANSSQTDQLGDGYAVRRVTGQNLTSSDTNNSYCLRVWVNPDTGETATAPKWVQVQLIASDNDYGWGPAMIYKATASSTPRPVPTVACWRWAHSTTGTPPTARRS